MLTTRVVLEVDHTSEGVVTDVRTGGSLIVGGVKRPVTVRHVITAMEGAAKELRLKLDRNSRIRIAKPTFGKGW